MFGFGLQCYLWSSEGALEHQPGELPAVAWTPRDGLLPTVSADLPAAPGPLLRLTVRGQRTLVCAPDQQLYTADGWRAARLLTPDDSVALVRWLPGPTLSRANRYARWIGWMMGNGCYSTGAPSFTSGDADVRVAFAAATSILFGFLPRHELRPNGNIQLTITRPQAAGGGTGPNPVKEYLKAHGFWGTRGPDKSLPRAWAADLDDTSLIEWVAGVWDTDGSVSVGADRRVQISYGSVSERLAWQILWALDRLGVHAGMYRTTETHRAPNGVHYQYTPDRPFNIVDIGHSAEMEHFRRTVTLTGRRQATLDTLPAPPEVAAEVSNVPRWAASRLREYARDLCIPAHRIGFHDHKKRLGQHRLESVLDCLRDTAQAEGRAVTEDPVLRALCDPSILWRPVREVVPVEPGPRYARTTPERTIVIDGFIASASPE